VGITDDDGNVLLSIDEVRDFLEVSRATVYRLIHRGAIEKRKRPRDRMTYVPLSSLESYKAAQGMSLEEMAVRIVQLERQVNFLMFRGQAQVANDLPKQSAPKAVNGGRVSLEGVERVLRKHHPGVI